MQALIKIIFNFVHQNLSKKHINTQEYEIVKSDL